MADAPPRPPWEAPDATGTVEDLLRLWVRDTNTTVRPGPVVVALPSAGFRVVADVERASAVSAHRFGRVLSVADDGTATERIDPASLREAMLHEMAERGGHAGSLPCARDDDPLPEATPAHPGPGADVARALAGYVDLALAAAPPTTAVLTERLLPLVGRWAGIDDPARSETALLDVLRARVAAARDELGELADRWLTAEQPVPPSQPAAGAEPTRPEPAPVGAGAGGGPGRRPAPVPERAGPWRLRRVRPHGEDLRTICAWMRRPHVRRFFGQPWPEPMWARDLARHGPGSASAAVLAERERGGPDAYLEFYRPLRHALADSFPVAADDLGVHVCVGGETGRGTGSELLGAVGRALLDAEPACPRVLAEPDSRNDAAIRAFRRGGFTVQDRIALPHKHATIFGLDR